MPFDNMTLSIFAIVFLIAVCIIQIQFAIQWRLNKVYFVYIKLLYSIIEDVMDVINRTSNTAHNEGNNPSNIEKGQKDERRDD